MPVREGRRFFLGTVRPTAADHLPARAIRTTLRVCRRDGTLVPVQAALTGWRASSGPVRALLLRDLSPLEAASALVRESESRFEALAEAAREAGLKV